MTVGGMGFIPERLLMMMMMRNDEDEVIGLEQYEWNPEWNQRLLTSLIITNLR